MSTKEILDRVERILSICEKHLEPGTIRVTLSGEDIQWFSNSLKIAVEALEFYSDPKNFKLISDEFGDGKILNYESYGKHSIGDFGVKAVEALLKIQGGGK